MYVRTAFSLVLLGLFLSGCGFGGFGGDGGGASTTENSPVRSTIAGAISYGPVRDGSIKIYVLNSNGAKGDLLVETDTDDNGNYEGTAPYAGSVIVEGRGNYTDPATGQEVPLELPLRAAAVAEADKSNVIVVTPLTELALQKALQEFVRLGALSASTFVQGNSLVSEMFKVDILGIKPAIPEDFAKPETKQSPKDYYLALATMSEMASANGGLKSTLNLLSNDLFDDEMSKENAGKLLESLRKFLASERNSTGITDVYRTNLLNVGGKAAKVRVTTNRKLAGTTVKGIEVSIAMPLGYTVRSDYALGKVMDGAVTTSGSVNSPGILYVPPSASTPAVVSFGMVFDKVVSGDIAVISCDLPAGARLDLSGIVLPTLEGKENPRFFDENGTTVSLPDLSLVFSEEKE